MTEYNDDLLTSKTQQKRDDSALQELGLSLMDMKPAERERLPLGDELKKALDEAGVADDTILRLTAESDVMERFGPLPNKPIDECERRAAEADVVVCIVAHRYGYIYNF